MGRVPSASLVPRASPLRWLVAAVLAAGGAGDASSVLAQGTAAPVSPTAPASVSGIVVDSLHGGVLVNAEVQVDGANRAARTDASGLFRIDSLRPGPFRLGVYHPLLDSLGIGMGSAPLVARPGDSLVITLATPSAPTVATLACRNVPVVVGTLATPQTTGPGVVVGRVLDADTDEPVPNVQVAFTWVEVVANKQLGFHQYRHTRDAVTSSGGDYRLCHLPVGVSGTLRAGRRDGGAAAAASAVSRDLDLSGHILTVVTLHMPAMTAVTIADLAAQATTPGADSGAPAAGAAAPTTAASPASRPADTTKAAPGNAAASGAPPGAPPGAPAASAVPPAPRPRRYAAGAAVLTGTVMSPQAQAVVAARVYVMGAEDSAQTDAQGQFTLRNLPSGSRTVVVRAIGYEPVTQPVELTTREPRHIVVPFTARAVPTLKPVQVVARLDQGLHGVGFDQRKRQGLGTFWTLPDIEKHKAYEFHDLFTTFPGLKVDYNIDGRASLMATRGEYGCIGYNAAGQATIGSNCGPCVAYVIDGAPYAESDEGDLDTYVHPQDVGALEIYQPNSVPRSIAGVIQPNCLNIVIWTKAKLGV